MLTHQWHQQQHDVLSTFWGTFDDRRDGNQNWILPTNLFRLMSILVSTMANSCYSYALVLLLSFHWCLRLRNAWSKYLFLIILMMLFIQRRRGLLCFYLGISIVWEFRRGFTVLQQIETFSDTIKTVCMRIACWHFDTDVSVVCMYCLCFKQNPRRKF